MEIRTRTTLTVTLGNGTCRPLELTLVVHHDGSASVGLPDGVLTSEDVERIAAYLGARARHDDYDRAICADHGVYHYDGTRKRSYACPICEPEPTAEPTAEPTPEPPKRVVQ